MTKPSAAMTQTLVEAVKAHAVDNYNAGGWDVIVECWDDDMITAQIGQSTTVRGAIRKFAAIVDVYADYQADAINSAF